MKLFTIYFVFLAAFLSSCVKRDGQLVESLILANNGWRVQSLLVHSGSSTDELNSNVLHHYKDIGTFHFIDENNGVYSHNDTTFSFTWSVSGVRISFEIEDLQIYTSPFIYYYFAGREKTPFTNTPQEKLMNYNAFEINDFTIHMVNSVGGSSSSDNFGDIEILLTKETN